MVANLTTQFIADQQQWDYQNFKRDLDSNGLPKSTEAKKLTNGEQEIGKSMFAEFDSNDKKRGFVSKGLWAWSRHPNFACEQTTW